MSTPKPIREVIPQALRALREPTLLRRKKPQPKQPKQLRLTDGLPKNT